MHLVCLPLCTATRSICRLRRPPRRMRRPRNNRFRSNWALQSHGWTPAQLLRGYRIHAHHQDQFAMEYGHGRLLEVPSPDARGREKQEGRVEGSSAVSQGLAGSGSVGQSAGGERFRDRLRLRGRRLVSRVRDSSTAVQKRTRFPHELLTPAANG